MNKNSEPMQILDLQSSWNEISIHYFDAIRNMC